MLGERLGLLVEVVVPRRTEPEGQVRRTPLRRLPDVHRALAAGRHERPLAPEVLDPEAGPLRDGREDELVVTLPPRVGDGTGVGVEDRAGEPQQRVEGAHPPLRRYVERRRRGAPPGPLRLLVSVHQGRGQQVSVAVRDPAEQVVPASGEVHVVLAEPELVGVETAEHRHEEGVEVAALDTAVLGHRGVPGGKDGRGVRVGVRHLGMRERIAAEHEVPRDEGTGLRDQTLEVSPDPR